MTVVLELVVREPELCVMQTISPAMVRQPARPRGHVEPLA